MSIRYKKSKISENTIQILAVRIGKLETKAISKLIEEMGLSKILEKYLTKKEQDIYYKSKYKLRELLLK